MCATNVVVEEVEEGAVGAIDGHEGPLLPRPQVLAQVGHVHVGVLQPGVEHQPRVGHQVRAHVQRHHRPDGPHGVGPVAEPAEHSQDADVRPQRLLGPLAGEERVLAGGARIGPEVVGLTAHGAAGGALQQVQRPPDQQHADGVHQGEGALAERLAELVHGLRALVGGQGGHVGLALGDVVGAHVVHRVRPLPRKVRHQQERVQDVADGVLDELVVGEGAVAALVRRHPRPGAGGAGGEGVRHPRADPARLHGDVEIRKHAARAGDGDGARRVREGLQRVLLEAVLRDHAQDFLLLGPLLEHRTAHSLALKAAQLLLLGVWRCHGRARHGGNLQRAKGLALHRSACQRDRTNGGLGQAHVRRGTDGHPAHLRRCGCHCDDIFLPNPHACRTCKTFARF
mmetsp:Transcript_36948/g.80499  ORF Transcript_36948/g.80499 Transcript_36948/m.80499 type:complete len:398 (+) Transcript_36948:525-1718(+)